MSEQNNKPTPARLPQEFIVGYQAAVKLRTQNLPLPRVVREALTKSLLQDAADLLGVPVPEEPKPAAAAPVGEAKAESGEQDN